MPGDGAQILGPRGEPLSTRSKGLIVINTPRDVRLHDQFLHQLGKETNCLIIVLPPNCYLMMGELANQELESMHQGIHAVIKARKEEPDENKP